MNVRLLLPLLIAGMCLADDPPRPAPVTDVGTWYLKGEPEPGPEWSKDGAVDFTKLQGKVVVLKFWLTYCPGCKVVRPTFNTLHEENPDDLVLLGITVPDAKQTREDIRRYVKQHIPFPVGVLERGETIGRYKVGKIPHVVVIDRAGTIAWVGNAARDTKGFKKAVRLALAEKAADTGSE